MEAISFLESFPPTNINPHFLYYATDNKKVNSFIIPQNIQDLHLVSNNSRRPPLLPLYVYLLVPEDLDHLDLVLLLLPLVLGDNDEVCVGGLVKVLDGVVQQTLHVDLPQR